MRNIYSKISQAFKPILVLLFSIYSIITYSQVTQLKITVLDEKTCETIPFAAVILKERDKQIATGQADINGEVTLKDISAGKYTISASYLGYKPIEINNVKVVNAKTTYINVYLKPNIVLLKECVIISYKRPICCFCCRTSCSFFCCGLNSLSETDTAAIKKTKVESYEKSIFKAYPNPTSNFITVEDDSAISTIHLLDISGKTVAQFNPQNATKLQIDLSSYAPGTYFLNAIINEQPLSRKIVLTR